MENEYNRSAKKEEEIKHAFEKIKEEIGIHEPKELLTVFNNLHQKTVTMESFVQDLSKEIEELDNRINALKEEIQLYNVRGATFDQKKREEKTSITQKIEQEEKKKLQYKMQYEKLLETLNVLKNMIENTFVAIGEDEATLEKIRNSALTEENMIEFIGILERKGLDIIGEYSRLLAEQIRLEKDSTQAPAQLEDLNNIIAFENANMMAQNSHHPTNRHDHIDEVLNNDGPPTTDYFMSAEQLRQSALEVLNNKKSGSSKQLGNVKTKARATGTATKSKKVI